MIRTIASALTYAMAVVSPDPSSTIVTADDSAVGAPRYESSDTVTVTTEFMNRMTVSSGLWTALPFALGIAVHKPELTVTVISGDGDLTAIGGNHLIHAARRNVNLNVICINNFNYGMTGGQVGPTTPLGAKGLWCPPLPLALPLPLPLGGCTPLPRPSVRAA